MKIQIELDSFDAVPSEVWQALENRRAEIEWARRNETVELPKFTKPPKVALGGGIANFIKSSVLDGLKELRP